MDFRCGVRLGHSTMWLDVRFARKRRRLGRSRNDPIRRHSQRLASEKRLFRFRKLGAVIAAREQMAVDIHGDRDKRRARLNQSVWFSAIRRCLKLQYEDALEARSHLILPNSSGSWKSKRRRAAKRRHT